MTDELVQILAQIKSWYGAVPDLTDSSTEPARLLVIVRWLIESCGHGDCPTGKELTKTQDERDAWRAIMGWDHEETGFGSIVERRVVRDHTPGFDTRNCLRCKIEARAQETTNVRDRRLRALEAALEAARDALQQLRPLVSHRGDPELGCYASCAACAVDDALAACRSKDVA